jgi:hypothetical protein
MDGFACRGVHGGNGKLEVNFRYSGYNVVLNLLQALTQMCQIFFGLNIDNLLVVV